MFCPKCRAEYRPGFTRCSDCDVDLVDQLPAELDQAPIPFPPETQSKRVWFCDDQKSCVYVCAGLRAAGIPFEVAQRRDQLVFWQLDEHYEVFVPSEFYEKAKAIAEQGAFDFSDSDEDRKIMELPDAGSPFVKHDKHNGGWRPEDATVEVWAEKTEERAWFFGRTSMIELSLHENGIGTYINVSPDGFRKIFVRPEDESQAREIVREIETGTPPK